MTEDCDWLTHGGKATYAAVISAALALIMSVLSCDFNSLNSSGVVEAVVCASV